MKKLRIAVIGAGRLGTFHARKLSARDDVKLVGVVDPVLEARSRLAHQCGTEAFSCHRSLIGQIDAAVVAAPTSVHHSIGIELLHSGIHVLMEKPLAASTAEAEQLVDTANRHGVVLQVGHVERFNPAFVAALPHVPGPKYVEAVRAGRFTFRSTDIGVVLDLMIHDLDLVLFLVRSPVRRVDALGISLLGQHEDVANARIEFASGCVATLSASRVSRNAVRRMQIFSPKGMAAVDLAAGSVEVIRPSRQLLERQFDLAALSPEEVEYYKEHLLDEHLPCRRLEVPPADAIELEVADFLDSIRNLRRPRVSGEDGYLAVQLAEQVLQAIAAHCWEGDRAGPVGPMAAPRPEIIPAPHWQHAAPPARRRQRRAS